MSHRGGISRGCNACRRRKVKCDEVKPVCTRCQRTHRECIYRDPFELVHRDQSRAAELRTSRTWRSRAGIVAQRIDEAALSVDETSKCLASADQSNSSSTTSTIRKSNDNPLNAVGHSAISPKWQVPLHVLQRNASTSLRQQPAQDLYSLAFCRFCYDFLDPPNHAYSRPGTFAIIPPLCTSLPANSALVTAVRAVSLANFAARMHHSTALGESRKYYVKSLAALGVAMGDTTTIRKAETVLTSYMLWLYEVVSKPDFDSAATTHLLGSENIMKFMSGSSSKDLLAFAQTGFGSLSVSYAFLRQLAYYEPPTEWLDRLVLSLTADNLRHRLWRICHMAVRACARMKKLEFRIRSQGSFDHDEVLASTGSVRLMGVELEAWQRDMKECSPLYVFEIQANLRKVLWVRQLFDRSGAPHKMHAFEDSQSFFDWKLYWTSRLNVDLCLLDLVEATSNSALDLIGLEAVVLRLDVLRSEADTAVDDIIEVADSMLAAIPCVLGVQPPTDATVKTDRRLPEPCPHLLKSYNSDPRQVSDIGSLRGYHLFWPLSTLWRALNRKTVHDSGMAGSAAWLTYFMRFLWRELGIAQSESCVRWYQGGFLQNIVTAY